MHIKSRSVMIKVDGIIGRQKGYRFVIVCKVPTVRLRKTSNGFKKACAEEPTVRVAAIGVSVSYISEIDCNLCENVCLIKPWVLLCRF